MRLAEWSGAAYLFFLLCACIVAFGYLFLTILISYLYIGAFVLAILSQGVGHG